VRRPASTLLWLVRSGETTWDEQDRLRGDEDLPLSKAGRAATTEAFGRAAGLPFPRPAVFHHAMDQAASETARIASTVLGGRCRGDDELADPALGVLAGLAMSELRDRFERRARQWEEDPSDLVPPEGEPIADARARIVEAVAGIVRRRPEAVGIVVHDLAAGLLRAALAGQSSGNPRRWMEGRPRVELWSLPENAASRLLETVTAMSAGGD
jgi:broad specificity phosphatase PhoE